MVTLRRVVSKTKSFQAVQNPETRMKLLEIFINQVLEQNQRKAMQDEIPMSYKEVLEVAKDKLENVPDHFPSRANSNFGNGGSGSGARRSGGNERRSGQWTKKEPESARDLTRRLLKDQKLDGKEFCLDFNIKDESGGPACKSRSCRKAHNCAYIPRGETKACGGKHSKINHAETTRK